jgi:hypothetical protein
MPEGVVIRHIPRAAASTAGGAEAGPGGAGDLGYDLEVFVTTVSDPQFGKTVTVTPPDPRNPPAAGAEITF